jgi:hypothetical protein
MKKSVLFVVTVFVACLSVNAQFTTRAPKTGTAVRQRSTPPVEVERIGKIEKATSVRFNPNLAPVKDVISSRRLKDGSEFRIVRLENGVIKKQLFHAGQKSQRKVSLPDNASRNVELRAGAASESLNEGFEGWDRETWDWIPEGWTDESKVGSDSQVVDIHEDEYNFTWKVAPYPRLRSAGIGQYSAGVQFALTNLEILNDDADTIPYNPPLTQDEWLISPQVTVKQADYVFAFDLYYDPAWARLSYLDVDENYDFITEFEAMHTVIEALISTDGGNTWTVKWDNREDAARYTDDELRDILFETGVSWIKVSIDLKEYLNRDIKIAIRYWDDGGESAYVDNVAVGYPAPVVYYRRPQGHLISGYSTDYRALQQSNLIVGHAYTPTQWEGTVENQESIRWQFNDSEGNSVQTSTEQNPVVSLPYGLYNTPLLSATGRGNTKTEFQLGAGSDMQYNLMGLGGQNSWDGVLLGLGNYDIHRGVAPISNINAEDLAGEGTFIGVSNFFEKPAAPYMLETFYVHAGEIVTKPNEPVRLKLFAVADNGVVGDVIASSEAWPADFIRTVENGYNLYTIPFKFIATDPETGREYERYLEIDDHFLAEFSNYRTADMFFQAEYHPTGEYLAYISFEESLIPLGATSALFDMNASFPFLFTRDNKFAAPDAGGVKAFEIDTYWAITEWWLKEDVPDWIAIGDTVYKGDGIYSLSIATLPLPEGVSGRSANVTFQAPACELTLQVKQGDGEYSGINTVNAKSVKVFSRGDYFVLSYPVGTPSVAIYNVAGQKIAEYALNSDGTYSIPVSLLPKGVYILRFAGKTNETVKVVK